MHRATILLVFVIILDAHEVGAKLRPKGEAFPLSDCAECEWEVGAAVAGGDRFYVTWCASLPAVSFAAFGRAVASDGTPGASHRFGDDSRQTGCRDVGVDGAGNFVVLWQHPAEIWLQRFDALGQPQSVPLHVNVPPTGLDDDIARLGVDPAGFAAVGFFTSLAGEPAEVWARVVAPDDRRVEPAVRLSGAFPVVPGDGLRIATLGDTGVFFVLWQTRLDPNQRSDQAGPKGLSMRRIDRQGRVLGPEIVLVEPSGSHFTLAPDLAGDPRGEFLVATWQTDELPAGASGDVVAVFVDSHGDPVIGPIRLNKRRGGSQVSPRVEFTPRNEVVVVWETDKRGSATLFGRRLRRSGAFRGRERKLSGSVPAPAVRANGALAPEFALLDRGGVGLVVWTEEGGLIGRLVGGAR